MQPLGVVRVAVQSAHIHPWSLFVGSAPDAFLTVGTQQNRDVARTKYEHHNFEPTWMETLYIVVHPQDEFLEFSLRNHHEHRSSTLIGSARFPTNAVMDSEELTGANVSLSKGEKNRADLLVDLTFHPLVSSSQENMDTLTTGIISFNILEAAELDTATHHPDVYAQVSLGSGGSPIHTTQRNRGGRCPVWNSSFDSFCSHLPSTTVTINVIEAHHSEILGYMSLCLEDMLNSSNAGVEWWPLNGCKSCKIKLSIKWWPVNAEV